METVPQGCWAITPSVKVFKNNLKPLSGTSFGDLGFVGDSFAPLIHCLILDMVVFVSERL